MIRLTSADLKVHRMRQRFAAPRVTGVPVMGAGRRETRYRLCPSDLSSGADEAALKNNHHGQQRCGQRSHDFQRTPTHPRDKVNDDDPRVAERNNACGAGGYFLASAVPRYIVEWVFGIPPIT